MSRHWLTLCLPMVVAAGCGQEQRAGSRATACRDAGRPGYFVPGSAVTMVGCARLGVSGKRVEFSAHRARIGGDPHVCINPAFAGRGRRGMFIPAVCIADRSSSRHAILGASQPRQGVRGYAFVIWGTTGVVGSEVVAESRAGTARAAVFRVASKRAEHLGVPPFGVFVVELPLAAACGPVNMRDVGAGVVRRVRARPRLCARGSDTERCGRPGGTSRAGASVAQIWAQRILATLAGAIPGA